MFLHLPIIFIHLLQVRNERTHFIHHFLRKQHLHIRAEAGQPRIERLADLNRHRHGEILLAIWNEHRILTEAL